MRIPGTGVRDPEYRDYRVLASRIPGSGILAPGPGIPGAGIRIPEPGIRELGVSLRDPGLRIPGPGIPNPGSGPMIRDPGVKKPWPLENIGLSQLSLPESKLAEPAPEEPLRFKCSPLCHCSQLHSIPRWKVGSER